MSQVNVNPGGPPVREDAGERSRAAGINLAAVLIVVAIVILVLWLQSSDSFFRGGSTNVDVNTRGNPPAQTQPAQPTAAPGVTNPGSGGPSSKP